MRISVTALILFLAITLPTLCSGQFTITPFGGLAFNSISLTDQNFYNVPGRMDVRYFRHDGFGRRIWEYGLRVDRVLVEDKWQLGFSVARRISEHPVYYASFVGNFASPFEMMRVVEYPINVSAIRLIANGFTLGGGLAINIVQAPDVGFAENAEPYGSGGQNIERANQQFGLHGMAGYRWRAFSLQLHYTQGLFWRSRATIASPLDADKNLDYLLTNFGAVSLQLGYAFRLGKQERKRGGR